LTFSRRAKEEMSERAVKLCGSEDIEISTFHSLCHHFLRLFGAEIGIKNFQICKDLDQRLLLRKIVEEEQLTDFSADMCIHMISEAKNKKRSPQMIKDSGKCGSKDFYIFYSKYQAILKEKNWLDYDDLLVEFLNLLNRKKFCEQISSKIKYLLVDEFQDTNDLQFEFDLIFLCYSICMKLISVHQRIMVVGDPEQTIFTWRYANMKNLDFLIKKYPKVQKIYLTQNYRSTQTILRASSKLMSKIRDNSDLSDRELISKIGEGEKIIVKQCLNFQFELKFIAEKIFSLISEKSYNFGDFSILCRNNSIVKGFLFIF
jgi:DNA helicase II / ATP-dependent DNA helicase PcrA